MSAWLTAHGAIIFLGVPLVCYVLQGAAVYALAGRYGMCLAMVSYAMANVGLILDAKGV